MAVVVIARIQDCSVSFNLYFKNNKRFKLNVSELDQPSLKPNLRITRALKLGSKKLEYYTLFFFFYKNIFYKNIEAEICEILRIF